MGLLDNQTQQNYYTGLGEDYGSYQFISLDSIIANFMIAYVGEGKIISKANRTDVQFHGMRAIQELSYDVFRSIKDQEIEVPSTLRMPLPQDYVNYVKLVRVDSNGIERVLYPTGKTSNPFPISQQSSGYYNFNTSNDNLNQQGLTNTAVTLTDTNEYEPFNSNTLEAFSDQTETNVYSDDSTDLEIDNRGMLINKEFLNQDDLNKLKFTNKTTKTIADQESFVSRALSGVITKIDDPLGKKRGSLGQ